ncbi:hypothetical protein B0O99DRAFT_517061 [Bisporella sp. PMI_857]|nr:hypothetical protein B0O99DRAFT_517061 [Bisporella sp. PMI_857]
MAATTRQPFGELNQARLQNLTSLKNRQNGTLHLSLTSPTKRKATAFDADDSENINPILFLSPKKSKISSTISAPSKPVNYFLTKAPPSPSDFSACLKPVSSPVKRPILPTRSPAPKISTSLPLSVPAGRSPSRKRIGILNRRKTGSPFTRIDPPKFASSSASTGLGFSIDAALSGTIPSYKPRAPAAMPKEKEAEVLPIPELWRPAPKDGWFFDIHEDTEEELATNLMEHGACTLDLGSDEEDAIAERADRGKENVPPMDDVSQTSTRARGERTSEVEMDKCDIDRNPLGDLKAKDYYAVGCGEGDVFLVPVDDDENLTLEEEQEQPIIPTSTFDFVADINGKDIDVSAPSLGDVDMLMQKDDFILAPKAALLEPIEKAEEGFEVWESASAKGDD